VTVRPLGDALDAAVAAVESSVGLDRWVRRTGEAAAPLSAGAAREVLSGAWIGHALHPMLTDLPIGFWTSSFVLDLVGGRPSRPASQRMVALGLLSVPPTALAGWSDWASTSDQRIGRVGLVHAATNAIATATYAKSWLDRRRGRHAAGVAWAMVGATLATVGGHLGGHLVFRLGAGVSETPATTPSSTGGESGSPPP
jgi:uncharacterized membrane protein